MYVYIILYRRADQAWSAQPRNIISDLFPETDRPVVEYGNLTPVMEACGKERFWPQRPQRQVVGLCVLASHILVDVRPTWIPIKNCCVITSKKCCILVMNMNSSSTIFAGITCVSEHTCQCKDSHILFYGNLLFQEQNLQLTENFTIKALYKWYGSQNSTSPTRILQNFAIC